MLLICSQHQVSYDHKGLCQALSWHLESSYLKDIQLVWKSVLFEWRPEIMTLTKKKKGPVDMYQGDYNKCSQVEPYGFIAHHS